MSLMTAASMDQNEPQQQERKSTRATGLGLFTGGQCSKSLAEAEALS